MSAIDECSIPIGEQLFDLLTLDPGWHNGDGFAYNAASLVRIHGVLVHAAAEGIPIPYIYPTPEGEVRCEWPVGDDVVLMVVDGAASSSMIRRVPGGAAREVKLGETCAVEHITDELRWALGAIGGSDG